MRLGETVKPVGYGEGFVFGCGDLMASRTRAVENAPEKMLSIFCVSAYHEGGLRSIGRDPTRYLELDRNRFLVDGLELEKKISP